MIRIISKGMITRYILPYLSKAKRGFACSVPLWEVVNAILYKFRSGIQWSLLPCKSLILSNDIKYGAIYHHFNKWSKDGSWHRAWINLLKNTRHLLDLSLVALDGTHSLAKRGGQQVAYQRRRRAKTTNALWLTDRLGNVIAFFPPIAGNHNDLYGLAKQLELVVNQLKKSHISVEGWFLNADAGFDSKEFRSACEKQGITLNCPRNRRRTKQLEDEVPLFDELMYDQRYVIERTNAWMDNYRSMLNRFDTSIHSWTAWHYIFSILFWIKRIEKV